MFSQPPPDEEIATYGRPENVGSRLARNDSRNSHSLYCSDEFVVRESFDGTEYATRCPCGCGWLQWATRWRRKRRRQGTSDENLSSPCVDDPVLHEQVEYQLVIDGTSVREEVIAVADTDETVGENSTASCSPSLSPVISTNDGYYNERDAKRKTGSPLKLRMNNALLKILSNIQFSPRRLSPASSQAALKQSVRRASCNKNSFYPTVMPSFCARALTRWDIWPTVWSMIGCFRCRVCKWSGATKCIPNRYFSLKKKSERTV